MAKVIDTDSAHKTHAPETTWASYWPEAQRWLVIAYTILATIALGALSFAAHNAPYFSWDLTATRVVQSVQAGWYNVLMQAVGDPGYPPQVYALVVIIILALYLTGFKWEAMAEVFATVGIGAVGLLIKTLVNRPRPSPDLVHVIATLDAGKLSFPAGHVESYVAIIGFLWFISFVQARNPWVRSISLLVFGEMIALIGISRVYTGEHWLSDSIGGYLFGSIWLVLTIWFYNWGKPRFFLRRTRAKEPIKEKVKAGQEKATEAVQKPVITWRQRVAQAGVFVSKSWRHYRAAIFQGYLVLAIVFFAVLAVLAHTIAYFAFDVVITDEIQRITLTGFAPLMLFLSDLGFAPQVDVISALVILFLYVTGLKWEAVTTLLGVISISLVGGIIKIVVQRPRPSPDIVHVLTQLRDYSFPSGHVLYFTVFYGFLLFLAFTLLKPSWSRTLLIIVFTVFIGLIGISRIDLGEHWPSDVFAAYLLGSVWLYLTVYVYRWGKPRFFADQPVAKGTGMDPHPPLLPNGEKK
ncbi:MAG: phosphatase PAP2 family protein [Chloroflexi bacterium]|nr:phosphatase PAP2 family protein [Chloroflexota bacterium]